MSHVHACMTYMEVSHIPVKQSYVGPSWFGWTRIDIGAYRKCLLDKHAWFLLGVHEFQRRVGASDSIEPHPVE